MLFRNSLSLFSLLCLSQAVTIFDLSDTSDALFEHDTNGVDAPSPLPSAGSQMLSNGEFEWENLSSDTTRNTAEFSEGAFAASDWGGLGQFTSSSIDVSGFNTVDIFAVGSSQFNNAPTEFFDFFYSLDGVSVVTFSGNISDLDVSGVSNLEVGFSFNHNGSADNVEVDELRVEAIPEPGSLLLLGIASVTCLIRRYR